MERTWDVKSGNRGLGKAVVALVGAGVLATAPTLVPRWGISVMTLALGKGLAVLGVVMLLRGGLASFGHGLFFAGGAYAAALVNQRLGVDDGVVLLVIAAAAGMVLGGVTGAVVARHRGIFFAMLTVGLAMVAYGLLLKLYRLTGGSDGLAVAVGRMAGVALGVEQLGWMLYYLALLMALTAVAALGIYWQSPAGCFLAALRFNEVRLPYVGVSGARVVYVAWVMSGVLGGLGGAVVALELGRVDPRFAYWTNSAELVFVAALAGTVKPAGAVAGALVFEWVRMYALKVSPYTWQLTLGGILLFLVFAAPEGLLSLWERGSGVWRRIYGRAKWRCWKPRT